MPEGCNGPHNHTVTCARANAHWAIAFAHAYELTGKDVYKRSAECTINHLLSGYLRPMTGSFWCRRHVSTNSYNGLIGQAWCLEALGYCGRILEHASYIEAAREVFNLHEFDGARSLWYQMDIDGSPVYIEGTLNQQIWFASVGAELEKSTAKTSVGVKEFVDHLESNVGSRASGLLPRAVSRKRPGRRRWLAKIRDSARIYDRKTKEMECGYHLFSLCGLARLHQAQPLQMALREKWFIRALRFLETRHFQKEIMVNRFAMQYNVPGFELLFVVGTFAEHFNSGMRAYASWLAQEQIRRHFNHTTGLLENNTVDPETLSARIYEIYRIPYALRDLHAGCHGDR